MNNQHLKKTLQLIRRTGDRAIIIDEESDELFVLMDINGYEKLLPPISKVTANQMESRRVENSSEDIGLDNMVEPVEQSRIISTPVSLPQKISNSLPIHRSAAPVIKEESAQELNFNEDWTAKQSPAPSEESLADLPHDGEEEEKFYLEPVA